MLRRVHEVQRDFALSSVLRSEIIWDSLSPNQSDVLKEKIKSIFPDSGSNEKTAAKARSNVFDCVWKQRRYTNRTLLSAIIYVMVAEETNPDLAKHSTVFTCHPVFRTRKCMNASNSAGCCMIFVDEHGRVYQNWNKYIENNVLPKGMMIAPVNGIYSFDDNDELQLECHLTPNARTKSRILKITDKVVTVGGIVAVAPAAAAFALPIAAPVAAVAVATTVSTCAYSAVRSALHLTDRRRHEQSVSLNDREARNNWLGVATGVIGIGAAGATKVLTRAAASGPGIAAATQIAVKGINVSATVISGTGFVSNLYDLYMKINDEENIQAIDVLRLASSLLVFTHSINNLRMASKVASGQRGSRIRETLREQMRKVYSRVVRSNDKFDIIRTLNEVPLKEALMRLPQMNAGLAGGGVNGLAASGASPGLVFNSGDGEVNIRYLAEQFGSKFVQQIINPSSLLDVLNSMTRHLHESVFRLLMNLARVYIDEYVDNIDRVMHMFVSTETVVYRVLMQCVTKYSDFSYAYLESKTGEILGDLERYFQSLNPVNSSTEAIRRACPTCKGYFYICTL